MRWCVTTTGLACSLQALECPPSCRVCDEHHRERASIARLEVAGHHNHNGRTPMWTDT